MPRAATGSAHGASSRLPRAPAPRHVDLELLAATRCHPGPRTTRIASAAWSRPGRRPSTAADHVIAEGSDRTWSVTMARWPPTGRSRTARPRWPTSSPAALPAPARSRRQRVKVCRGHDIARSSDGRGVLRVMAEAEIPGRGWRSTTATGDSAVAALALYRAEVFAACRAAIEPGRTCRSEVAARRRPGRAGGPIAMRPSSSLNDFRRLPRRPRRSRTCVRWDRAPR